MFLSLLSSKPSWAGRNTAPVMSMVRPEKSGFVSRGGHTLLPSNWYRNAMTENLAQKFRKLGVSLP